MKAFKRAHFALCRNVVIKEIDAFDVADKRPVSQRFHFQLFVQFRQKLSVRQETRRLFTCSSSAPLTWIPVRGPAPTR